MARRAERRRRRAEKARAGEAQPAAADGARKEAPPVRATRTQRLIPFVLLGAGLYAFHNSFYGPFIFDDRYSILVILTISRLLLPWTALLTTASDSCPVY